MDTAEITRQANRIKEQAYNFSKDCLNIVNHLRNSQDAVEEDNPELSAALKKLWNRYNDLAIHAENQYKKLAEIMIGYCYKSDEISKMATADFEKLNAELQDFLALQI